MSYTIGAEAAYRTWSQAAGTGSAPWVDLPDSRKEVWNRVAEAVIDLWRDDDVSPAPDQSEDYVAVIEEPWIPKVLIHGQPMDMLHPLLMTSEQRNKIDHFGKTYVTLRETPADQITDEITRKAYADCGTMLQIFIPKLDKRQLALMDLTDRYALIHACFIAYDRIVAERQNRVVANTPQEVVDALANSA